MSLIGRKVKGFKFESNGDLDYMPEMDNHIGEVGEIVHYVKYDNSYGIQFKGDYWRYPADQIEAHLVGEWVVGEWVVGEDYEFRDDEDEEWEKGKLLGIVSHEHKYITLLESRDLPYSRKYIRHINPQIKEVTIEEAHKIVAEKLGVSSENLSIVVK